jgi:hypothetical protein
MPALDSDLLVVAGSAVADSNLVDSVLAARI